MPFNAWDNTIPVKQARLRNRCLVDEEIAGIEDEIIERIKKRIHEHVPPKFRRAAIVFVAQLAGVDHPKAKNALGLTDLDVKTRNLFFNERHAAIDATDWQAHLLYARLVADAGQFAQERIQLIDERTRANARSSMRIATKTSDPATSSKEWMHEERRALMEVL